MTYKRVGSIPVWGVPDQGAVEQMNTCARSTFRVALMADHHLGYAVPIGGVVAYEEEISPSGVGFDIACGNKAVLLDADAREVQKISHVSWMIYSGISLLVWGSQIRNGSRLIFFVMIQHGI